MPSSPPLAGLTVLDFSHALAGPYCTMLLAAYGADVYKIEDIDRPDMGRTWGPPFQGGEASYFLGLHSGKKGVSINLKHAQGRQLALRLIEKADILVENFRPGLMEKLGLGWEEAKARNSRLLYCSISGYGQNGPSRDEPAMDLIMQAACGMISVTGTPEGATVRCGHSVADITAGLCALSGILLGLHSRNRTGLGQFIDVSMLDSMISSMASNFANYLGSGVVPQPLGTAFATIVPYATFPTADREIAIAAASEKLWLSFCEAIGRPDLAANPLYATNPLRVRNRHLLEPLIVSILQAKTASQWLATFRTFGIPCSLVRSLKEVVEDPQTAARDMFPSVEHSRAGPVRITGVPIKLSDSPGSIKSAAPVLAQHTRESLETLLGIEKSELDALAGFDIIAEGSL